MLKINNLYFSYGSKKVLNGINLEINHSECIGILGKNGCGKSTLLSIICGIYKSPKDSILIDSQEKIGYIPQDDPLIYDLTGYDNINLWYKGNKKELIKSINSPLIKSLGIDEFIKLPVKKMSGGMRRKITIAAAIINNPNYIILDEPTAALDIPSKYEIKKYLNECKSNGTGILFTSHDEAELEICDKLYILKNGLLTQIDKNVKGQELAGMLI